MCGRFGATFTFREIKVRWDLQREFPLYAPRFNIAPSQDVLVIASTNSHSDARMMRWGLVPSWAKDPTIGNRMINARAETLTEKGAFNTLIDSRRCLVPASGFYEWRKEGNRKVPIWFYLKSKEPFAFAALWDSWRRPDGGNLKTFTIITTEPNDLLRPVHDRMPVIVRAQDEVQWLDSSSWPFHRARAVLRPFASAEMSAHEVSSLVNEPLHDAPDCIQPFSSAEQPGEQMKLL